MKKNIIIRKRTGYTIVLLAVTMGLCLGFLSYGKVKAGVLKEEKINYTVNTVKDKKESVVINQKNSILYGEDLWNSFLEDTKNNKKSHICVYFTENEYDINNYIDLTYDGSYFTVKKSQNEEAEKYKYIYSFDDAEKTSKIFWLMNEEGITYEEYERRMASAIMIPDDESESCILFLVEN